MNEETIASIKGWLEKRSAPNDAYAYSRCPVCNSTWRGDFELHNFGCWVPGFMNSDWEEPSPPFINTVSGPFEREVPIGSYDWMADVLDTDAGAMGAKAILDLVEPECLFDMVERAVILAGHSPDKSAARYAQLATRIILAAHSEGRAREVYAGKRKPWR